MKRSGANFAIFGSISRTTRPLIIEVETIHQKARLNKYLAPDLEWSCSLLNVHLWWVK